ncbi:MFS transporter [Pseudomonas kurunegalensis]|uniref:MFS transporter n=1 Tax=Pseudomonas kurunegalensis TaxID=485880 RepID=UPI00256FDB50|nr:MFS transporter [Pseudomonas kurunegalensis]WJD60702.1 MFS transporter [Pseudomonas kurunegalensis]
MDKLSQSSVPDYLKGIPVTRIFIAAFVTQFCMGFELLLRLNAANTIKHDFFDATNTLTSGAMIGEVLGVLFLGFAIANMVMSGLVDVLGLRRVHVLSLLLHVAGTATVICARPDADNAFMLLWAGSLMQGLAWGSIEAALNPLVVSIYPTRKVAKLNLFHAAFALGMLLGAPACVMVEHLELGWRIQLALVCIPAALAFLLIIGVKYPPSERVAQGVSLKGMFQQTFGRAVFYLIICVMFISAATEVVPSSWIDLTLTKIVGIEGFWLVAFIYSVHVVVRLAVGVLHARLGSSGILFFGALFSMAGLYLLSQAASPVAGIFAALLFGVGTSVMWPTMLATTSERLPGGGALAIGLTASAGMSSSYVLMPLFGKLFDHSKIASAGGEAAFAALKEGSAELDQVLVSATTTVFQTATLLPCALVVIFALLWLYDSKRKHALGIVGAKPSASAIH